MLLTIDEVRARRNRIHDTALARRVMFRVNALFGLSKQSVPMPLSRTEAVESGQICLTLDPDPDPGANTGLIDYEERKLVVRYGVQAVFPGLFQLIRSGNYDPSLLHPVRAVATDECTLTGDFGGFRALGCLEFLPGSIWAGADGG